MTRPRRGDPPPYTTTDPLAQSINNVNIGSTSDTAVHKIVVGVDFGTTYTGISWVSTEGANVKTLDDVHCIRDWPGPGRDADYSWKTPSRIAYGVENDKPVNAWGYEATKYDDPGLATSEGQGVLNKPSYIEAVELCADYLQEVATFAYKSLVKRLSAETLAATPLEFWFTVPAVWSDRAKSDTLRAARRAGRLAQLQYHKDSQLYLIQEPEAAAIATISSLTQGGSQQQIKPGDSILICDCGGGTVDVTTYKIATIHPSLSFSELVAGTGGKCGSTYIDREFIKWMEAHFGEAYKKLAWQKKGPASRLMKDFEGHKRDFGKSQDPTKYYEMQCLMRGAEESKYYDEDSGIVRIYEDDMCNLFKPVVRKIIALIESQLDAEKKLNKKVTIKTVILVGGFGDSAYLNDEIRAWCSQHDIRLICPEHPQAAIVRGAALRGLYQIQPTSRRARRHYGFATVEPWDPMRHRAEDKFFSSWDGRMMGDNNLRWELAKGSVVDENTKISLKAIYTVFEDTRGGFRAQIYSSDLEDAPDHARWPGSKKVATFAVDFTGVDLSSFPQRWNNGRIVRSVECEFRIHFGARRGVLAFSCIVAGKDIGNTTVTFDGQEGAGSDHGPDGGGAFAPTCGVQ